MGLDLYNFPPSGPCRAVQMTAKAIGVELNLKSTNLLAGEHLTPEYLKINPQHTVPTLVDDGFAVWESRAIQTYLVEKYAKTDSLYPKNPQKRAIINQRLYFDAHLYARTVVDYYFPQIFAKQPANPDNLKKAEDAFAFLETFLEGQTYVAGDHLTVADISLLASVSTAEVLGFDLTKYPNVQRWYAKAKATTPGNDINEAGVEAFKKTFLS